jgi:hypothetical protein
VSSKSQPALKHFHLSKKWILLFCCEHYFTRQSEKQDFFGSCKMRHKLLWLPFLSSFFYSQTHMSFTRKRKWNEKEINDLRASEVSWFLVCRVHVVRYFIFWFSLFFSMKLHRQKKKYPLTICLRNLVISLMQGVYELSIINLDFCAMLCDDLWPDA